MKFSKLVDPLIVSYVRDHCVRESEEQTELRRITEEKLEDKSRMLSSPEQMQLLQLLLKLTGAKKILEIGCFTGYSALSFAQATESTKAIIVTLDVSEDFVNVGKKLWERAGVSDRIQTIIGPALESLKVLKNNNETFDFVFLDADKVNYPKYIDLIYDLVPFNGLLVVDNVLWSGRVLDEQDTTPETQAIRECNDKIRDDYRWDIAMETIADGCTFLRKK